MIFDAVKRFLGLGDVGATPSGHGNESISTAGVDVFGPYRQPMPPDISQMELEIAQVHKFMEQQLRSMMGSFGFTFGSPFSGFEDSQFGSAFPFSPEIHDIPHPEIPLDPKSVSPALDPRDEVLKPQFRSRTSEQWNGQDRILDERLHDEDFGSVIDKLKSSDNLYKRNDPIFDGFSSMFGSGLFRSGLFGNVHIPDSNSGSVISSSTVTIYSNVNGHRSVEKIIRHPDGKIERIVKSDDGNPQQPL